MIAERFTSEELRTCPPVGEVPVTVLHVVSHIDLVMGGSIVAAFEMAHVALGEGVGCTMAGVVRRGASTDRPFRERYGGLGLELFPLQFPRRSFNSIPLWRWLRRHVADYDLVHIHGVFNFPYLFGARAALGAGVPLVVSPHGSLDPFDLRKRAALKQHVYGPWFVRPILAGASAVLCTSPIEAARVVTYGARPAPRMESIPLPVAGGNMVVVPGDVAAWRQRHRIPPDHAVVLFLSRIDAKKGLDLLIPAFAKVRRTRQDITLVLAGSGDALLERELRALAGREGLEDAVRWLGFIEGAEKRMAYAASDVFALPSYNENFGLVIIEALHAAKPVLISREVYIHELLHARGCAEISDTTVESVAAGLLRLLEDADRRRLMGERGRQVALEEFSPAAVRGSMRAFYRSVARERRVAGRGAG